jgi:hypothetical protein
MEKVIIRRTELVGPEKGRISYIKSEWLYIVTYTNEIAKAKRMRIKDAAALIRDLPFYVDDCKLYKLEMLRKKPEPHD